MRQGFVTPDSDNVGINVCITIKENEINAQSESLLEVKVISTKTGIQLASLMRSTKVPVYYCTGFDFRRTEYGQTGAVSLQMRQVTLVLNSKPGRSGV